MYVRLTSCLSWFVASLRGFISFAERSAIVQKNAINNDSGFLFTTVLFSLFFLPTQKFQPEFKIESLDGDRSRGTKALSAIVKAY